MAVKFTIKDAPRCKSMDDLVKRLAAGEVPPVEILNLLPGDKVVLGNKTYKVDKKLNIKLREVPLHCKEDKLAYIDKLSHAECEVVRDRVQARLSQIRTKDLPVYGIKRTYRGETRYYTRVDARGWGQLLERLAMVAMFLVWMGFMAVITFVTSS